MALSSGQSYSQALQYANRQNMHTSADMSNRQEFTRETEVTAKLPQKRTRQCIYDLLTKIKFPITRIESIVERIGGLVDFTCQTVSKAKQLAVALRGHQGVEFVRLVLSEYINLAFRRWKSNHGDLPFAMHRCPCVVVTRPIENSLQGISVIGPSRKAALSSLIFAPIKMCLWRYESRLRHCCFMFYVPVFLLSRW